MQWTVTISNKANKQLKKLPEKVVLFAQLLVADLEVRGPKPGGKWRNYSKIIGNKERHHCHLIKGRPTYVACWEVLDKKQRRIEVYYVGTHENAPY